MDFIKYKVKRTQEDITAIQLSSDNIDEVVSFLTTTSRQCSRLYPNDNSHAVIELNERQGEYTYTYYLFCGFFIITNPFNSNSIHIMKEEVFNSIYELAN